MAEATKQEMKKIADGDRVKDEPLDPEHKRLCELMRVARLIEEGKA